MAGSAQLARLWSSLLAFLTFHLWLAPGLIFAGFLLILLTVWRRRQDPPQKPLQRRFHVPDLARFQGIKPRNRPDLEA